MSTIIQKHEFVFTDIYIIRMYMQYICMIYIYVFSSLHFKNIFVSIQKWVLFCYFHVLSIVFICNTLCLWSPPVTSILMVFMSSVFHCHHSLLPLPSFFSWSLYCLDVAHRSVCVTLTLCVYILTCVYVCVYIYAHKSLNLD